MSSPMIKKTSPRIDGDYARSGSWLDAAAGNVLAGTAEEITAEILAANAYTRDNLKDMDSGVSSKGSLQFWSSGGLIQRVSASDPGSTYVSFALTPKYIEVVVLEEGKSAVAMYYSEGSFRKPVASRWLIT